MHHATTLLYHVHAVSSRNKWFDSCATSGKLRPGADQTSKAAFGKSAFAKTCYNVLSFVKDMTWRTPIEQKAKMLSSTI